MKKIVNLIVLVGLLVFVSCATQESLSTINQPKAIPKTYTTTETVTATHPDGTVVTTQKTSVVVPREDGTYEEKLSGPETIVEKTAKMPVEGNSSRLPSTNLEPIPDKISYSALDKTFSPKDYMSDRERDMLNEINLVRTNPKGYIAHIENYKADIQKARAADIDFLETELIAADELIRMLSRIDALPALKEHRGLYEVAKSHGEFIHQKGYPSHLGADGSYPWERITKAISSFSDGNENLVSGPSGVRESLILLLVDGAIQGRGHRKTLLQKDWQYGACFEVGNIESIPNVWIQNFAKGGVAAPVVSIEKAKTNNTEDALIAGVDKEILVSATNQPENKVRNLNTQEETAGNSWGGVKPAATEPAPEAVKEVPESMSSTIKTKPQVVQAETAAAGETGNLVKEAPAPEKIVAVKPAERASAPEATESRLPQPLTANKQQPTSNDHPIAAKSNQASGTTTSEPIISSVTTSKPKVETVTRSTESFASLLNVDEEETKPTETVTPAKPVVVETRAMPVPEKVVAAPTHIKEKPALEKVEAAVSETKKETVPVESKKIFPPPSPKEENSAVMESAKPTLPVVSTGTASENVPLEERRLDTARPLTYMTDNEKDMIFEINRVRANPKRYIRFVEEYKAKLLRTSNRNAPVVMEELAAIDELISQLNSMESVNVLMPHEGVYRAARGHGEELKKKGRSGHIGADGSYPWDRILREDPSLKDGNENLVGGPSTIQEAVILLLIDSGIPNRGHRKTILHPQWKYVAVYEVGSLGSMKNNWVQNFAN